MSNVQDILAEYDRWKTDAETFYAVLSDDADERLDDNRWTGLLADYGQSFCEATLYADASDILDRLVQAIRAGSGGPAACFRAHAVAARRTGGAA